MPDTQNKDPRQAVIYLDYKPCIELTAEEFIYPLTIYDDQPRIRFHLSQYEPYEVKKFYDQLMLRRRARGRQESILEIPDSQGVRDFIDAHFLRMSNVATDEKGTEPTIAQQREFLSSRPDIKLKLFREGIDRFRPREEPEKQQAPKGKAVLIFGRIETRVVTEMELYSPERTTDEWIRVVHVMTPWTESDRHQYEKSIHVIEHSRRQETYVEANWDVITGIYDQRIKCLQGACIEGLPCDESIKADWIGLVPFCMKVYAAAAVFTESESKNV